jgi:hypothetical protein
MPVTVIIQNAAAGRHFRVNSEHRPDAYLFTRHPERWNQHELVFPTAEEFNAASPDLLRASGNPPMHVIITPDPPDAGLAAAQAELDALKAEFAGARAENALLWEELKQAGAHPYVPSRGTSGFAPVFA